MLIRITNGSEGIKNYLLYGLKKGCEKTREERDKRVSLTGDLDITDKIIERMTNDGAKYLHITMGFKEDHIPAEVMRNIVNDFEEFTFAAYHDDEYSFYAEAHLPKISSYYGVSGDLVERKPHIHLVIPRRNLLNGKLFDPFGNGKHNIRFINAFQEVVNKRYGLASPKDNRRLELNVSAKPLARIKGDSETFNKISKRLKENVLKVMLGPLGVEIVDQESLKRLVLSKVGKVKVRNEGRVDQYLNVTPETKRVVEKVVGDTVKTIRETVKNSRAVNLKDYVFSPAFLALPMVERIDALRKDAGHSETFEFVSQGKAGIPENVHLCRLREWKSLRSREMKYLRSKDFAPHKGLSGAARADALESIIAVKEADFYLRYEQPLGELGEQRPRVFGGPAGPARSSASSPRSSPLAVSGERLIGHAGSLAVGQSIHDLRSLSSPGLARGLPESAGLLAPLASDPLVNRGAMDPPALRLTGTAAPEPRGLTVNPLEELLVERDARAYAARHAPLIKAFDLSLDAYSAASLLEQSHALVV